MDLMFPDTRRPLIHPIGITEVRLIHLHPVIDRPLTVHAMSRLGGHAIELIPFFPEGIGVPSDFLPRQLDIPDGFIIMMLRGNRNPIVLPAEYTGWTT